MGSLSHKVCGTSRPLVAVVGIVYQGTERIEGLVWYNCFRFGRFLMGAWDLTSSLDVLDEED